MDIVNGTDRIINLIFPIDRKTSVGHQRAVWENERMTGVQFVTDGKGRKVAVLIDLKKHGARLQDFWDGLISESRRKEVGIPLEKVKADLVKRGRFVTNT